MNIDVHCHFDQLEDYQREYEIKENKVIGVAVNYESGNKLLEYKKKFSNLKVCLGIHPEYIESYHEYQLVEKQIRKNIDEISAIGEIGLPYFNLQDMEDIKKEAVMRQGKELFEKFLLLAHELELPVNLHCVENGGEYAVNLLKKYNIKKALFHWFEGKEETLDSIKKNNWNISISPDVIYNPEYRSFVEKVPLEIISLESDGPWKYNNITGVPSMIEKTAEFLSEVYFVSKETILDISNKNAINLFGK